MNDFTEAIKTLTTTYFNAYYKSAVETIILIANKAITDNKMMKPAFHFAVELLKTIQDSDAVIIANENGKVRFSVKRNYTIKEGCDLTGKYKLAVKKQSIDQ